MANSLTQKVDPVSGLKPLVYTYPYLVRKLRIGYTKDRFVSLFFVRIIPMKEVAQLRFFTTLLFMVFLSCSSPLDDGIKTTGHNSDTKTDFGIPDWTTETHEKGDPGYAVVFPQDRVNSLEITMTESDWTFIQSDMKVKYDIEFGEGGQAGGGGMGNPSFGPAEPDYVAVSLKFNGKSWYKVGFRLKGNSSLVASWRSGIYKLPFRLNFDRFEDDYPQIKNQRFYGFKELSLSPGANDNSLIREKAGSDIFRMAGIPSSQTAFYKVYINFGSGLAYCGIYTMTEVVDDTMITSQFDETGGNIYKPESTFQVFKATDFEKKNNEDKNDFEDIQTTISTLHSNLRTNHAPQWRTLLEKTFNVDHFLKWLAVNTTMLNWDTYGTMAHNYYLYHHPTHGLTWIPWDNNEAMMNRGRTVLTLSLSNVSSDWPLIRFLMDDPVYQEKYKIYVREFAEGVFTPQRMNELLTNYHNLISPYVIGPLETEQPRHTHLQSQSAFTSELTILRQHIVNRQLAVDAYLP